MSEQHEPAVIDLTPSQLAAVEKELQRVADQAASLIKEVSGPLPLADSPAFDSLVSYRRDHREDYSQLSVQVILRAKFNLIPEKEG